MVCSEGRIRAAGVSGTLLSTVVEEHRRVIAAMERESVHIVASVELAMAGAL